MDGTQQREKFISLLKESVLSLCKNGLMDDHGITRVDGLLGITLQNKEVFLVNIKEELLPSVAFSCGPQEIDLSTAKRTRFESARQLRIASESKSPPFQRQSFGRRSQRSPIQEEISLNFVEIESDVEDRSCIDDDKEESLRNVSRLSIAGSRNRKDEIRFSDEPIVTDVDSEERNGAEFVGVAAERLQQTKNEPDDLLCNVSGATVGSLQNLGGGYGYKTTGEEDSALLWSKDHNDVRFPSNLLPCGYLPPLLGYHRRGRLADSSPSASSLPFPGLLPMFYNGAETLQALSLSQQRNIRPTSRQLKKYCCDICNYKSNRSYNLLRHVMHVHAVGSCPCTDCGIVFHNRIQLRSHQIEVHGDDGTGNSLNDGNSMGIVKMEPEETVNS